MNDPEEKRMTVPFHGGPLDGKHRHLTTTFGFLPLVFRSGRYTYHLRTNMEYYLVSSAPVPAPQFSSSERAAVVAILRDLCGQFGDNEWPDDLNLADVIERHLANYLWEAVDK